MGAFGPRRIELPDTAVPPPPPYRLVDNEFGLLDQTDLVFIDPVGTGFSQAIDDDSKDFFGVDGDLDSVARFIERYLSQNMRWNSPRFLAGESYGTTRAAALALRLHNDGIVLNGLILVSVALNFQTFVFEPGNDLPYILYLPSYAATAHYHQKLQQSVLDLESFLTEVRTFAFDEYAPALLRGSALDPAEKKHIAAKLSQYTGLPEDLICDLKLRIPYMLFAKKVLGRYGFTVGRLDSRYVGADTQSQSAEATRDPSYDAPHGAYASVINDYLRGELGVETTYPYTVLSSAVNESWKWEHDKKLGYINMADALRRALIVNPHMQVLMANGLYDLATPFFAAEYTANQIRLELNAQDNVRLSNYEAGHMMYFHPASLEKLKQDIVKLISDSLQHLGSC